MHSPPSFSENANTNVQFKKMFNEIVQSYKLK